MTHNSDEMSDTFDLKDFPTGYMSFTKHYTPDWLLFQLFFVRVLVVHPDESAYGKFLIDLAISYRVAYRERAILVITPNKKESANRSNHEYTRLRSNLISIYVVPKRVATVCIKSLKLLRKFERLFSATEARKFLPTTSTEFHAYWRRRLFSKKFPVHFDEKREFEYDRILKELGVKPDGKFVTMHIRDSRVDYVDGHVESMRDRDRRRSADLKTYEPAIRYLIDRGYTVIRIGTMSYQGLVLEGFVDLTERPNLSKIIEPFLILNSRFMIGTDSGPSAAPYLTNTLMLLTNSSNPLVGFPIRTHDIQLLRPVSYVSSGLRFGIDDYLSLEFQEDCLDAEVYKYGCNSAEEILFAVKEMESLLGRFQQQTSAQLEFSKRAHETARQILTQPKRYPKASATLRKWGPDNSFLGYGRVSEICFTPQFVEGSAPI